MKSEAGFSASPIAVAATGRKWNPGFFSRFPLFGLGALALSLCCTATAIAIVLLSDGQPTSEWSGNRQPGVLLAYTSTIANALLAIAFAEAVVIAFWTRALRGVPMSSFHHNWGSGTSVVGVLKALMNGRAFMISSVSILVAVTTLLRGPLMQRASFVQTEVLSVPGNIDLQMTYNITPDWAAVTFDRGHAELTFRSNFSKVIRAYQARSPVAIPGAECDNCTLTLPAFGFRIECSTGQSRHYNFSTIGFPSFRPDVTTFESTVTRHFVSVAEPQSINVTVMRRTEPDVCEGNFPVQSCLLTPARVTYELLLNAGNVSFKTNSWRSDSVGELLNLNGGDVGGSTTIRALQFFGSIQYDSISNTTFGGGIGWTTNTAGLLGNTYAYDSKTSSCGSNVAYNDPMDDILNAYRELALRISVAAAAEGRPVGADDTGMSQFEPYSQNVAYTSELVRIQYAADRRNLAVAVVISLLGPVATLVLFWGWWQLGRSFSLSPLEIANAFGAPNGFLASGGSNASGDELAKHVKVAGDPMVRYGVGGGYRLVVALAAQDVVRKPQAGEVL
ncbi:hypothetical protein QBC34DRAFT_437868 [Podospora aff. communis PSN243]|uniref:Uncharacterized protein n=1 Tax=Podospora aff. communis PSN243 TaxID=3040156 RepID=A0AAV9GPC2_9PEZI|nr:hypothetical protein QBC34DRAFT_437868 [Podospora aff. communis PSN243]